MLEGGLASAAGHYALVEAIKTSTKRMKVCVMYSEMSKIAVIIRSLVIKRATVSLLERERTRNGKRFNTLHAPTLKFIQSDSDLF